MLHQEIYDRLQGIPAIDIHSHLRPNAMAAPEADKVLFYHMLQYPLRAAGVPEERLWRAGGRIHDNLEPYEELVRAWPSVSSTSFGWALTTILRDLYGFSEPLSMESLERFRVRFEEHAGKPDWGPSVLDRVKITDVLTSNVPGDSGLSGSDKPPRIHHTLERGFYSGTREFQPCAQFLEYARKHLGREITSLATLREAVGRYYDGFEWRGRRALVAWVSSLADFTPCDSCVIDAALASLHRGEEPDRRVQSLLDAAFVRCVCEAARDHTGILQLIYGTQFLTPRYPHPVQRARPSFGATLGHLVGEFPQVHFNLLNGYEPDEPLLCSLCLGYGNVSLGGFWWHTFYPSVMHTAWHRRLDMVPTSRLMGFFSDGYCVDWIYGRLRMTQRVLSQVLAEKIERGFYSFDLAVDVATAIMCATPRAVFLEEAEVCE